MNSSKATCSKIYYTSIYWIALPSTHVLINLWPFLKLSIVEVFYIVTFDHRTALFCHDPLTRSFLR